MATMVAICEHKKAVEWNHQDGAVVDGREVCPQCGNNDDKWEITVLRN